MSLPLIISLYPSRAHGAISYDFGGIKKDKNLHLDSSPASALSRYDVCLALLLRIFLEITGELFLSRI